MTDKSITAYEDLPFAPAVEGGSVDFAILWGDPSTGPVAFMVRLPEGYAEPWHFHSATYRAVLVKGAFQSRNRDGDDGPVRTLQPGAVVVQPGGEVHSEVNAGDGDMVAFVYSEGPLDFILAD